MVGVHSDPKSELIADGLGDLCVNAGHFVWPTYRVAGHVLARGSIWIGQELHPLSIGRMILQATVHLGDELIWCHGGFSHVRLWSG